MQPYVPPANPDTQQLVEYLQGSAESERVSLSRELHDELGGLLVSVVMDVAFAEQNLQIDDGLRRRLGRVRHSLAQAIDLKRRMIEHLRPSILDNFGLFQALRWEVKTRCNEAHVMCGETYPVDEPSFTKEALIGLFRIGQEFLNIALGQPSVSTIHITVAVDADALRIVVSHDGRAALSQNDEFAIRSTAHRAQTFDGQLSLRKFDEEGAVYCAQLPLARLTQ
jgi:signal transduction histidine kinase